MEVKGVYPALVCNIKDPEKRGRIKVTCADIFGDTETSSGWCEPCVTVAVEKGGDIAVPAIDEGVWITFIDGDIDRPVYLGGWWGKNATPFGSDYENNLKKRVVSFEDNTITMEKGKCTIEAGDCKITMEKGKITFDCDKAVFNGDIE